MKISELIEELGVMQGVHGDTDVSMAVIGHDSVLRIRHIREIFAHRGSVHVTNMSDDEIQGAIDAS